MEFAAAASASERKREVQAEEFLTENKRLADGWMSMCKRSEYDQAWLLENEKEIWVRSKNERKQARRERVRILNKMRPMPFEEWLEDAASNPSRNKKATKAGDSKGGEQNQQEQEEMRKTLRNMANDEYRGHIERQDREAAQNLALSNLKEDLKRKNAGQYFETLASEVRSGACVLAETQAGLMRIVAALSIHLERGGCLLIEIAQVHGNHIKAKCRLPEMRQMDFEPAGEALKRELSTTFAPFRDALQLDRMEIEDHKGKSEFCGLTSIYHKHVQYATMDTLCPMPPLPTAEPREKERLPLQFSKNFVFALLQAGRIHLYTWLPPDVFKHLAGPDGREDLNKWVDVLHIDEDDAKHQLAWTKTYNKRKSIANHLCNSLVHDIKSTFAGFKFGGNATSATSKSSTVAVDSK
jgi:hypothetical protein